MPVRNFYVDNNVQTILLFYYYIFVIIFIIYVYLLGGYVGLFVGYTVAQAPELLQMFMTKSKKTLFG